MHAHDKVFRLSLASFHAEYLDITPTNFFLHGIQYALVLALGIKVLGTHHLHPAFVAHKLCK